MKYQRFIFKDWRFDAPAKLLELHYSLDGDLNFTESYHCGFEFENYDQAMLDRAIQGLFLMAGVSYYKTYLPPEIVVEKGQLDQVTADFFSKTYQRGLGEFFYINQLDPHSAVTFPVTTKAGEPISTTVKRGELIGIGGGKDSLVSAELLRARPNVATWSLNHEDKLSPLIDRIGLTHYWVERRWDKQLLELNQHGAYNGHVPISAILAFTGTIVGILSGHSDAVVSNENSANEATLHYQGVAINHQYSKTLEFERDYQAYLDHCFGDAVGYYSFLRPLSELRIAELFAQVGFEKYHDVFSSCNRAFVHTSHHLTWCGICPKCAFVFLVLTPFIARPKVEALFGGRNLLLDPAMEPIYRQMLGIEGDKPLDCVGEIKESRTAMRLVTSQYPELTKYHFDIPPDYDYKQMAESSMPADVHRLLLAGLTKLD